MPVLPESLQGYFEPLESGLEALLPSCRIQNKSILLSVQAALQNEPVLTVCDTAHLKNLMVIADRVAIPEFVDVKTCCEVEAFLIRVCPQFSKLEIRLMMRWLFLLLARHGHFETDLTSVEKWFRIWRLVQRAHSIEQGLLTDYIRWLQGKLFAPQSILSSLREYQKLKAWMSDQDLASLNKVDNLALQRYLLKRACGQKNASKQKILASLRPIFYYYKEVIDGAYSIPDYSVSVPRTVGVNQSAIRNEIRQLWQFVHNPYLSAMARMMLVLILGYGLPLRALPLLRLTQEAGKLVYTECLPCRRGLQERAISLDLGTPWLGDLWRACQSARSASDDYSYLFSSGVATRRNRPVSVDYCQRLVQGVVTHSLGYPIPVNHLERGSIKAMAATHGITEFMAKTETIPLTKTTRLMYWLSRHSNGFGSSVELR